MAALPNAALVSVGIILGLSAALWVSADFMDSRGSPQAGPTREDALMGRLSDHIVCICTSILGGKMFS